MSEQSGFIYIEAKPKFWRFYDVHKIMTSIVVLCGELADGVMDCKAGMRIVSRNKLSFQITFQDLKDKDIIEQNQRFQELVIDLRLASKRDRSLRRKQLVATADRT